MGGAFSTAVRQSAFVNQLIAALPHTAPGIDPAVVIATGASELRNVFPAEVLPGIPDAYMIGLKVAFAVAIAFSGMSVLAALAIP